MGSGNKIISISEAADALHVSSATVLNWIKSGILKKNKNGLNSASVNRILRDIRSGKINRLNNRANKRISDKKILPAELTEDFSEIFNLKTFIKQFKTNELELTRFEDLKKLVSVYPELSCVSYDLIYQSLKSVGNKSKSGSYYTPDNIIEEILSDHKIIKGSKIYDPCCGTGRFLKICSQKFGRYINLYGSDTDETACDIAVYELSRIEKENFYITNRNSLDLDEHENYDFIFTNPPWGAHYSSSEKAELKKKYPEAVSGDSLEYFIIKGYRSLKHNGIMSYILPESFLYVRRFQYIRKFIAEKTKIIRIKNYGRIFADVFSGIIRIDIQKKNPRRNSEIITGPSRFPQSCIKFEPDFRFNTEISGEDRKILNNILNKPHLTLKNNAKWSLGIVTGNNRKYVRNDKNDYFSVEVVTGINIEKVNLKGFKQYLYNDFSQFQQVPKYNYFQADEKLIYRFISDRLVFAYDNSRIYTLNSANILIPQLKDYPIKAVMSILNSDLMNFFYKKKFKTLKVLRSNLEKLPFPVNPDKTIIDLIEDKTICIINDVRKKDRYLNELEDLIYKLYGVKR